MIYCKIMYESGDGKVASGNNNYIGNSNIICRTGITFEDHITIRQLSGKKLDYQAPNDDFNSLIKEKFCDNDRRLFVDCNSKINTYQLIEAAILGKAVVVVSSFTPMPGDFKAWVYRSPSELLERNEVELYLRSIEENLPVSLLVSKIKIKEFDLTC